MTPLESAVSLIAQARSIAVLTGAGVSAESGVPTFRGPTGGFWRGRDPMQLASPEGFRADPSLVWEFYNERRDRLRQIEPNPAHFALAELERRFPIFSLITQNVDRLHHRAGSQNVLEIHGNIAEVRCSKCQAVTDRTGEALPPLPACESCGGLLRPNVVWFGETLPEGPWEQAKLAAEQADVFLAIGTSALVYPAAGLVRVARNRGHSVIEINIEPSEVNEIVHVSLNGKAGEILPRLIAELDNPDR